jgi:hypothetical protein
MEITELVKACQQANVGCASPRDAQSTDLRYVDMKIAVLGWGSLIWNTGALRLGTDWTDGGPILPIEFSRISEDGRLTLVIDERHGVDVPTRYAQSSLDDLDEAITDLQQREGTLRNRIGFIDVAHKLTCDRARAKHPVACERIQAWVEDREFDAVVWTALGPRFSEKRGVLFSVDAAVRYIADLQEPTRTRALDYIRKAPVDVVTPLRKKVASVLDPSAISTGSAAT